MTDDDFLDWLATKGDTLRTPAYVYCESVLEESVQLLRTLMPDGARLFYSLKANPLPGLVSRFARHDVGAEIASAGERQVCMLCAVTPANVLVGGVAKSSAFLTAACDMEPAGIVLDSTAEWTRLCDVVSSERTAQILLRVNPGVVLGGLDMAGSSQFGFNGEAAMKVARCCQDHPHIEFVGLHFYFGSQRLEIDPILRTVAIVAETVETFWREGIRARVVDIGLGCGVPYLARDEELDWGELREGLAPLWRGTRLSETQIWSEAGRALAARCGYFVARVLEKKILHDRVFVFIDGGINVNNPGLGLGRVLGRSPRVLFVRRSLSASEEVFDVVGNLCTTADCLVRGLHGPELDEGDIVVVPHSGAYCQTTGLWGFNSQPLFSEQMLTHDFELEPLEPQYRSVAGAVRPV